MEDKHEAFFLSILFYIFSFVLIGIGMFYYFFRGYNLTFLLISFVFALYFIMLPRNETRK